MSTVSQSAGAVLAIALFECVSLALSPTLQVFQFVAGPSLCFNRGLLDTKPEMPKRGSGKV